MLLLQDLEIPLSADTYPSSKNRLVIAAVTLFQKRGYYGVGTTEILHAANVPRSSLYHYFQGGKSDLACASIAWLADQVISSIQTARLAGYSPEKLLTNMGKGISAWLKKTEFSEGSLLAALTLEMSPTEKDVQNALRDAYEAIDTEYTQMLVVAGLATAKAKRVARSIIADLDGAMIYARAHQDTHIISEMVARLCNEIETA